MTSSGKFTTPAVREYMLRARRESEETISVLANCRTTDEFLRGFGKVSVLVRRGTGNDKLAQAAEAIAAGGSQFSEDQLRALRDDFVRNARAFLSTTEGSI